MPPDFDHLYGEDISLSLSLYSVFLALFDFQNSSATQRLGRPLALPERLKRTGGRYGFCRFMAKPKYCPRHNRAALYCAAIKRDNARSGHLISRIFVVNRQQRSSTSNGAHCSALGVFFYSSNVNSSRVT